MALNDLHENIDDINEHAQAYIDKSIEYYKLSIFKKVMKGGTSLVNFLIIGAIIFLALFVLSAGAAVAIGKWIDDFVLGCVIVGVAYLIFAFIFYKFLSKKVETSILKKASEEFFEE
ncbi:phage holin family protein [Zhouia sp. PK063]|uniref:phage holin family protein n=1 Tax=Zhouia sp. PK063 TaxID=3373602 RepID=UPI00379DF03E